MLQDITPGAEIALQKGVKTGYIGFDPTAPSLTIGNLVQVMILALFQKHGHKPIVLMGGATGRIGDPSFKDEERQLKSPEEIERNLAHQVQQIEKLLDFSGAIPNRAEIVNNYDFYKDMGVLDFLRDVGKLLTVNYMLSKDSVKKRIETGLSFTEFSYQLIQGYDFVVLKKKYGCDFQMGGSDQWGNITAGTEMVRRLQMGEVFALTTPLLTKSDGKKFGKSEEGNIWLDPTLTSPYKFFQFWLNADDNDIAKLYRFFSFKSREEIELVDQRVLTEPRQVKLELAEELTVRIHSEAALQSVKAVSEILFNKNASKEQLLSLSARQLEDIRHEIPSFTISQKLGHTELNIIDLISEHSRITQSKGEARKAIQGNAVSVNKEKISSHEHLVRPSDWLHGRFLLIENGKKNKFLVEAE